MISRKKLVNALKEKNFRHKRKSDNVEMYKKSDFSNRINVPTIEYLDDKHVKYILEQAGFNNDEIVEFIRDCSETFH